MTTLEKLIALAEVEAAGFEQFTGKALPQDAYEILLLCSPADHEAVKSDIEKLFTGVQSVVFGLPETSTEGKAHSLKYRGHSIHIIDAGGLSSSARALPVWSKLLKTT